MFFFYFYFEYNSSLELFSPTQPRIWNLYFIWFGYTHTQLINLQTNEL